MGTGESPSHKSAKVCVYATRKDKAHKHTDESKAAVSETCNLWSDILHIGRQHRLYMYVHVIYENVAEK